MQEESIILNRASPPFHCSTIAA